MCPAIAVSETKLEANRQNAQLSTGPKSDQGKARVRLNGLRHGLTGSTVVMPWEDRAIYEAFIAAVVETLNPEGPIEQSLAETIANGRWRLNRARAIDQNILMLPPATGPVELHEDPDIDAALTQAQAFIDHAQQMQLLTLYESRIERSVNRAAAELNQLQAIRRAAHQQALEQATLLARLAESEGTSFDPASGGFGFSKAFLDQRIQFNSRLAEARARFSAPEIPVRSALRRAA